MAKTIKNYKSEIRALRNEVTRRINQTTKAEFELNHYRRFVRDKFEWYVELSGQNKYPKMVDLIITHVKFLNRREPFEWNMLPRPF